MKRETTETKTVKHPTLQFRADLGTINEEERTVEVIFSTGADVVRRDWWTGEQYIERLAMKPENVRLGSLNAGAPVVDTHRMYSTEDVRGNVVEGSARLAGGKGYATLRFLRNDEDADKLWNKITQKAVRAVSVAYKTHKIEETKATSKSLAIRTAVDWEPAEISAVPFPADPGATMRKQDEEQQFISCVIETRSQEDHMEDDVVVDDKKKQPEEPTEGQRAAVLERERVQGIITACRAAGLSNSFRDKLIHDGTALVEARGLCLEELDKRGGASSVPRPGPSGAVEVGIDELDKTRAAITGALLHRAAPEKHKIENGAGEFRSMTLLEIGRYLLERRGFGRQVRAAADKMTLAGMALGFDTRSGSLTTSDFSNILADVFNKVLRDAYTEAPATWAPLVRRRTVPDFKNINVVQFGDAPSLLQLTEHGEFKRGKISDSKETYALLTWGRIVSISRKAIINDDTNAFSRVPMMFGRTARAKESDLVWAQITTNPTMGDTNALFSTAHANYDSAGLGIGVTGVSAARAAIRKQRSLDNEEMNLTPRFLLVPTELETSAEQLVMPLQPAQTSNVNPFSGKLGVISEARLSTHDAQTWYLACAASEIDIIELASLEGEQGPVTESRSGFDQDGVEIKCRLDAAAKVIDYRGLYKNVGDT